MKKTWIKGIVIMILVLIGFTLGNRNELVSNAKVKKFKVTFNGGKFAYNKKLKRGVKNQIRYIEKGGVVEQVVGVKYVSKYDKAIFDEYEFIGWYQNKKLTKKFVFNETRVNRNMKLYPKYRKCKYLNARANPMSFSFGDYYLSVKDQAKYEGAPMVVWGGCLSDIFNEKMSKTPRFCFDFFKVGKYYKIRQHSSQLYLTYKGAGKTVVQGRNFEVYAPSRVKEQLWELVKIKENERPYYIRSVAGGENMVLDVMGEKKSLNSAVGTWYLNEKNNQKWELTFD